MEIGPRPLDGRARALQASAIEVGGRLRSAIADLLDRLAATGASKQQRIQSALDLSQSVTSRLIASVRVDDPLATLASAPAPEGLRKMLRGAARAGIEQDYLDQLDAAITDVEGLLDGEIGNRHFLDALLSEWVPDSRASYELRHKAAGFRTMTAVRGVQARAVIVSVIIYPGGDARAYDAIGFDALIGCRRLRPSAVLRTLTSHLAPATSGFTVCGVDDRPITDMHNTFIPEFSTIPWESLQSRRYDTFIETTIQDLPLGKGRGADLVTGQRFHHAHRVFRDGGPPTAGIGGQAEPPAEVFLVDALLDDDVWPGQKPELRLFDTVVRGITHPDNPLRQADRLDMLESIVYLGRGLGNFRIAEFPRYSELVQYGCDKVGRDPQRLRGFRCKIRYPIYGSQIGLAFPLPEAQP